MPESNGEGSFGEALSSPFIAPPRSCHTQTFISIGAFSSESEANNALKYLKTKFARTLLSVLKATQHTRKGTWKYVPIQNFSVDSDIDWSRTISEIDQQLYRKYGLTQEEIDFIEKNVVPME